MIVPIRDLRTQGDNLAPFIFEVLVGLIQASVDFKELNSALVFGDNHGLMSRCQCIF